MTNKTVYIRDDLGMAWSFDGERVYNILAEMEMQESEDAEQNGYPCESWDEAIQMLNEYGYITGFTEPSGR